MPTTAELAEMIYEESGNRMALQAAFESHREHCATDKRTMNERLDSINNKLWAGLVILALNFLAVSGYLVTHGTPWKQNTEIAQTGERK